MAELSPGDPAPPFSLPDQDGTTVSLSDFAGKKLLIYFYPKADTPGCTKQSCSIRDARPEFSALGVATIGVSADDTGDQKAFDAKYRLGFPLLADTDHAMAEAYGVRRRLLGIIHRSSFLVGEDGRIAAAWYGISPSDTVPEALRALAGEATDGAPAPSGPPQ